MATLRDIRRRRNSIQKTQQITKVMKMISAIKLKKAEEMLLAFRPYRIAYKETMGRLASKVEQEEHIFVSRQNHRAELLVICSDRGLCGAFNSNILKRAEKFLEENQSLYEDISLGLIGQKAVDYFSRRHVKIRKKYAEIISKLDYPKACEVAQDIIKDYEGGIFGEVYVLYSEFRTSLQPLVKLEKLLPLEPSDQGDYFPEYIYEPSKEEILQSLFPKYVEVELYGILLESIASEHGARMVAMEAATKNAEEMISYLTLIYNKARQASITKEIIEIMTGTEAMKKA